MSEKLVIIDGNSLMYRAYYGLPPLLSSDHEPRNAIFGFCKMLINVIQKVSPEYLIVAFDAGKHTFRHDIYEAYKGTRSPTPDDLVCQIEPLKSLLKEMQIKVIEKKEIEADDLIGSSAKKFNKKKVIIVSGDRDLFQLIDDDISVMFTLKGLTETIEMNEKTLKEKYGITPQQVIEMKSIMGDKSDNIPGVRGIGEKTALRLISTYNDLDNIYAHIDEIEGKVKTQLIEQKDMAYISKQLATIKTDVKLNFSLSDCKYEFPFNSNVYKMMKNFNFNSIIAKDELFNKDDDAPSHRYSYDHVNIQTFDELNDLVKKIKEKKMCAFVELRDNFSFSMDTTEYLIDNMLTSSPQFYEIIKGVFEDENIEKTMFDVKAMKHYFDHLNVGIKNYFDVSIATYLANESEGELSFERILWRHDLEVTSPACNLLALKNEMMQKLKDSDQLDLYYNIELKLLEVLYDMEKTGVKVDLAEIKRLSKIYNAELDEVLDKIINLIGTEVNLNSPKQLMKLLFEDLKLEYKGKKSTSVDVLEAIKDQHEVVPLLLRYRKISKIISTYLDGLLPYVDKETSKIHTTYNQTLTATGRLSSREPNLQNIPVRDDESKMLREMFISSFENGSILSCDYNQIELRLVAIMSGDENLLNDFKNHVDVHATTASKMFNVSIDEVTPTQRRMAKAVNFGIIYGISEYGLSKNLGTTVIEAKEFIKKYFELYPGVKKFMDDTIERAKKEGAVRTLYNRIRHIEDINSSNRSMRLFGERVAMNMPLQGTASDIIKIAMINVKKALDEAKVKSKLILQIHDELIIDVYPGEEEICKKILKENMMGVANFALPLDVSLSLGKTWLEAK